MVLMLPSPEARRLSDAQVHRGDDRLPSFYRLPLAYRGERIGLFGGSFNPAHEGHRHASLTALRQLGLDRVWWLVSPQNPLKPVKEMAPLRERLEGAKALARHPRIVVSDLESLLRTRYTVETLSVLRQRFPGVRFVLIIGADNLRDLPRWKDWTGIVASVPLAIIARPSARWAALSSQAAQRFRNQRFKDANQKRLKVARPPAWVFIYGRLDPTSSTGLRVHHG